MSPIAETKDQAKISIFGSKGQGCVKSLGSQFDQKSLTVSTTQLRFILTFHLRTEAKMYPKRRVKHVTMDKFQPVKDFRGIISVAERIMLFAVGTARIQTICQISYFVKCVKRNMRVPLIRRYINQRGQKSA